VDDRHGPSVGVVTGDVPELLDHSPEEPERIDGQFADSDIGCRSRWGSTGLAAHLSR